MCDQSGLTEVIDIKFTALMDFVARLRGRHPRRTESDGAEEFVPYEDIREAAIGNVEASVTDVPTATTVEPVNLSAHSGRRK